MLPNRGLFAPMILSLLLTCWMIAAKAAPPAPQTPPAASATRQADASYVNAAAITARDFVRRVGSVQLDLSLDLDQSLQPIFSTSAIRSIAQRVLEERGIRVGPAGPVTVAIKLHQYVGRYKQTTLANGRVTNVTTTRVTNLLADVGFYMKAFVPRGPTFQALPVAPVFGWALFGFDNRELSEHDIRDVVVNAVENAIEDSRAAPARAIDARRAGDDAAALDASFARAVRLAQPQGRPFDTPLPVASLDVRLLGEASKFTDVAAMRGAWTQTLNIIGLRVQDDAPWSLRMDVAALFDNAVAAAGLFPQLDRADGMRYYHLAEHLSLIERGVVLNLDGTLVRRDVRLYSEAMTGGQIPSDVCEQINALVSHRMEFFATVFRNARGSISGASRPAVPSFNANCGPIEVRNRVEHAREFVEATGTVLDLGRDILDAFFGNGEEVARRRRALEQAATAGTQLAPPSQTGNAWWIPLIGEWRGMVRESGAARTLTVNLTAPPDGRAFLRASDGSQGVINFRLVGGPSELTFTASSPVMLEGRLSADQTTIEGRLTVPGWQPATVAIVLTRSR